jgi:predicted DNA-binding transcriptional regulator AlpA
MSLTIQSTQKNYITVLQFASKINVCRATIYNYMKQIPGFPQPYKINKRLSRFDCDEVEAYMQTLPRGVHGDRE